MSRRLLEITIQNAYDDGYLAATTDIKKIIFGAKNMARARLRAARIEQAVHEQIAKRKAERHDQSESNTEPASSGSSEARLQGTTGSISGHTGGTPPDPKRISSIPSEGGDATGDTDESPDGRS